jgi:ABC-2 type transport system ATP-binding protein
MKINLSDLSFTYPGSREPALRDCALELDGSSVTVMVGNNGAGKSTLIRLLTGQLLGFTGGYAIDGEAPEIRRGELLARHRFGYVPDIPVLDSHLTGLESILLAGSFRGLGREQTLAQVKTFAGMFDLGDWLGDAPSVKYSKGMRKKVSLVIGFLGDPAYVFLDEPFDGLDPIAIFNLKRHLKERKDRGLGALLSSHMLDAAEKVADAIVIMKAGRAVFSGSYRKLQESRPPGANLEEIYFGYFLE